MLLDGKKRQELEDYINILAKQSLRAIRWVGGCAFLSYQPTNPPTHPPTHPPKPNSLAHRVVEPPSTSPNKDKKKKTSSSSSYSSSSSSSSPYTGGGGGGGGGGGPLDLDEFEKDLTLDAIVGITVRTQPPTHPPTSYLPNHPPTTNPQRLIPTASFSSISLSPTHPPTHPPTSPH